MFKIIARNNETDTKSTVTECSNRREAFKTVCEMQKAETNSAIVYCISTR